MSLLINSWLASYQSLPMEGVGMLQWERRPAMRHGKSARLEGPQWSLDFQPDPATSLPADFFQRLGCFGNETAEAARIQYRNWMQPLLADTFSIELPGVGSWRKQAAGPLEWQAHPLASASVADLRRIPFSADLLYRRWDTFKKFVVALTLLAGVVTLLIFQQAGWKPESTSSRFSVPSKAMENHSLPYREIR